MKKKFLVTFWYETDDRSHSAATVKGTIHPFLQKLVDTRGVATQITSLDVVEDSDNDEQANAYDYKVVGSDGFLLLDKTGAVVYRQYGCYSVVARFDLGEYKRYWGEDAPKVPETIDILDLAFWDLNQKYWPAEDDWRKEVEAHHEERDNGHSWGCSCVDCLKHDITLGLRDGLISQETHDRLIAKYGGAQ